METTFEAIIEFIEREDWVQLQACLCSCETLSHEIKREIQHIAWGWRILQNCSGGHLEAAIDLLQQEELDIPVARY
jgi:hypothetical protein